MNVGLPELMLSSGVISLLLEICNKQPIALSLLGDRLHTRRLTSIRPGNRWIAMSSPL